MSKRSRGASWDVGMSSVDTARVLMLLAQQQQQCQQQQPLVAMRGRVFECKTCSRQFPTFQALGGHRASHKRPRLLVQQQQKQHALGADDIAALCLGRRQTQAPPPVAAKPRVHECPVCGLEFAVGQALGGHMRRHRAEAEDDDAPRKRIKAEPEMACDVAGICLDLNLTPSENCAKCRSVAGLAAPVQGVHKALAMLDCSL